MPRLPKRFTQFQRTGPHGHQSWHYRVTGKYSGPGEVILENQYIRIVDAGRNLRYTPGRTTQGEGVRYHIHFKGTKPTNLNHWRHNVLAAFRGERIPVWDYWLDYCKRNYGYESSSGHGVHYTGFSRGSPLAMSLGGDGYGLGRHPFPAYPPFVGSEWHRSRDPIHDHFFTDTLRTSSWLLRFAGVGDTPQSDMSYGKRPPDQTAVVDDSDSKKPLVPKEEYIANTTYMMPADDPKNPWNYPVQIRRYRDGRYYFDVNAGGQAPQGIEEWDGTRGPAVPGQSYGNYDDLKALAASKDPNIPHSIDDHMSDGDDPVATPSTPQPRVRVGGDFSGLVSTFLNPVTSRILGYKGIPRKRKKFSTLEQYSPFWKEQHETPRSVFVAPSQA